MLSFVIAVVIMFAVVGGAMKWAVRTERRRILMEESHAGDH
jgi:hypothetical protein